jgi:hypothetical protein
MRVWSRSIAVSFILAACTAKGPAPSGAESPAPTVASPVQAEATKFADVVARTTRSVVLLLNTRADGSVTYGAGFLVGPGLVLTSEHVIIDAAKLGAMLHRPGRTSYTPMDGGLSRFLFENQSDIVVARAIAGDTTSDLALVQIDVDTSGHPTLAMAREDAMPGERIIALGHPQEMVWSFTQGIVGTIQQGAIQHDAAISHGSSGGPLLNTRGEVVGVNIAKVMSEAAGLSLARPIALAGRYLGDGSMVSSVSLDRTTPEAAALSCWHAQEIGRVETGECFDWEAAFTSFSSVAEEAVRLASPSVAARIRARVAAPDFREHWLADAKRHAAGYFVEGSNAPLDVPQTDDIPPEVTLARAEADREDARVLREHPDLRGLYADRRKPARMQARLRLGIRVDRVVATADDRAWVELAGRNQDGSLYRFSELYVRLGGHWVQRSAPLPEDAATLPPSFAPPLGTYAGFRAHTLEKLLRDPESLRSARRPLYVLPTTVPAPAAVPSLERTTPTCTAALCSGKQKGAS